MTKNSITIFTDGSSRGNPGPGGYGAIIVATLGDGKSKVTELGGREDNTTNNRMELTAALEALRFVESRKLEGEIVVHTDSAYLLGGVTGWMYGWEKNGWKTSAGEAVLNQDIWKEIGVIVFRLKQKHVIDWKKVDGHAGLLGNERSDEVATKYADGETVLLYVGPLAEYEKIIGGSLFKVDGEKAEKKKSSKAKGPVCSYVSLVGGMIATHKTWEECEARVKGKPGVKFKKAMSALEEQELIREWTKDILPQKL